MESPRDRRGKPHRRGHSARGTKKRVLLGMGTSRRRNGSIALLPATRHLQASPSTRCHAHRGPPCPSARLLAPVHVRPRSAPCISSHLSSTAHEFGFMRPLASPLLPAFFPPRRARCAHVSLTVDMVHPAVNVGECLISAPRFRSLGAPPARRDRNDQLVRCGQIRHKRLQVLTH